MSGPDGGRGSVEHGVILAKDVMVPMRDGTRLATDVYRPGRDGEIVVGAFPTILCRTPYDKTDRRYSEIADFFVPRGFAVCLQDVRDRYRSEGTREYEHTATRRQGDDGYDTIEWIAGQRWSNGRVGMVGSSYAAVTQVTAALERPPHLSAIWPDVVPTNSYQHQAREGGAMQLHMFWALFIHAQDAQDIADRPDLQDEVWEDLRQIRKHFWSTPFRRGQFALRHVPALEQALIDYYTRGAYDDYWAQKRNDFTAFWNDHSDIPGTYTTGWYDPFVHADTEYYATMAARNESPQRLIVGPWSHVGMRSDVTYTNDVDFGADSVWGVDRYFQEQLRFFDKWLRGPASEWEPEGSPVTLFVMGGGSGKRTPAGKLDHGGQWRHFGAWPPPDVVDTVFFFHNDGGLRRVPPEGRQDPRRFVFDPDHPVPTIGGSFAAMGELPEGGAGLEAAWTRFLSPVLRLRNILTPGPMDQMESSDVLAAVEPYRRLSEREDVVVFETEALGGPIEVVGRVRVDLWVSSSAVDTDFTAKLIDVYPPSEDYPDGYDLLLTDSVIRTRFRDGFDREVLMEPGEIVQVSILLPPTANVFARGHRIRIDISSSNFPRLDRNPNTGEPIGRHTRQEVAHQKIHLDEVHPSRAIIPVTPA